MKVEKAQKCVKKINENIWKKSMKIYEKNLWKSIKPDMLIKQKQVLLLQKHKHTQKETQTFFCQAQPQAPAKAQTGAEICFIID